MSTQLHFYQIKPQVHEHTKPIQSDTAANTSSHIHPLSPAYFCSHATSSITLAQEVAQPHAEPDKGNDLEENKPDEREKKKRFNTESVAEPLFFSAVMPADVVVKQA